MKKIISLIAALSLLSSGLCYAQMTDSQIIDFVKTAKAAGKSDRQISLELAARGVTIQQLQAIKAKANQAKAMEENHTWEEKSSRPVRQSVTGSEELAVIDDDTPEEDPTQNIKMANVRKIFGHNVFNAKNLSFEPNMSLPTPESYVLGPGDEVVIDIWGANEATFRQTISPEGTIMVSQIGPVHLSGLSIKQANETVKRVFSRRYSGVLGEEHSSEIVLTLGQIRTVQINIFGEVAVPGTYRLSSFSNVFHALYRAGGVTDSGSIRNVEVIRNGKRLAVVDIYPYLFTGVLKNDFQLQDGDVVRVPLYGMLANIEGNVKRPMYYEIKEGETVQDLIDFAGGFEGDAYAKEVSLVRQTGREHSIMNVSSANFSSCRLEAGDAVTVGGTLERFSNRVEIRGAIFRPGAYELGGGISTVKDLVMKADGLKEDAFTDRVRLLRQKDDFTPEVVSVNLGAILSGKAANMALRKNDILVIPSVHELRDLGEVTIEGCVARPGNYVFAESTTIEDLILQAGGLLDGASAVRVDVSRRINDPYSSMPTDTLAQEISFPLDRNLRMENGNRFHLQPYDVVRVRLSPGYRPQRTIAIEGEVAFPGSYTLLTNNERLSDLVKRAGGITPHSYVKGAILLRKVNEEELTLRNVTKRMLTQGGSKDSIDVRKLQENNTYTVGLNLEKALEKPGSQYDLVLREGDKLVIPEYLSTVKIHGDVMYPNVVPYVEGESFNHYIEMAGGYGSRAKRAKAYIVYMNGNVCTKKAARYIQPGCEIVIPSKGEKKKITVSETLTIATSTASLATMVATLARLFN